MRPWAPAGVIGGPGASRQRRLGHDPLLHRSGRLADMVRPTARPPDRPKQDPLPAVVVTAEPRQRWRLTYARDPVHPDLVGRAALDAWQDALVRSGLPVAGLEPNGAGRARIAFGAPLPAAARGEAELAEVWLVERIALSRFREALTPVLPQAHAWIHAEDIWLGAPPLAGQVAAAEWRISVAGPDLDPAMIARACRDLMAARSIPRTRVKGGAEKRYDLRPLVDDLEVLPADGSHGTFLRVRTRFRPELGSGRPEDVVAAAADAAMTVVEIDQIVRERLILLDDLAVRARR
jgi:uncharacterized protein DUF2344